MLKTWSNENSICHFPEMIVSLDCESSMQEIHARECCLSHWKLCNHRVSLKVPVSKSLENELLLHWQIWSLFQYILEWQKYQFVGKQYIRENDVHVTYCFIKPDNHIFFKFPRFFFSLLLNYKDYAYATLHNKTF